MADCPIYGQIIFILVNYWYILPMKRLQCATLEGIESIPVSVESTLTKGLPSFTIVGMASTAINEARERVINHNKLDNFINNWIESHNSRLICLKI